MSNVSASNLKRFYWVVGAVALFTLSHQFFNTNTPQVDSQLQEPLTLPPAPAILSDIAKANADTVISQAQSALANKKMLPPAAATNKVTTVGEPVSLWQTDGAAEETSIPVPDGVVIYEPVSVNMDSPAFPAPGDQVSLPLPGGETLVVNVESSHDNPNGDYSWRGHLEGQGTDYPVTMTYGANSVFATVTTPQGSYTLESVNGSGWIYKNPAEVELSDPGKNDYLDVPHQHAIE